MICGMVPGNKESLRCDIMKRVIFSLDDLVCFGSMYTLCLDDLNCFEATIKALFRTHKHFFFVPRSLRFTRSKSLSHSLHEIDILVWRHAISEKWPKRLGHIEREYIAWHADSLGKTRVYLSLTCTPTSEHRYSVFGVPCVSISAKKKKKEKYTQRYTHRREWASEMPWMEALLPL